MSDHSLLPKNHGITKLNIFNYILICLVFCVIVFFINMSWSSLNNYFKIIVTLGTAIAAYLVGVLQYQKNETTSSAFFLISALLIPVGILVTLNIYTQPHDILKEYVIASGSCFVIFMLSQLFLARSLFIVFAMIYGSIFYFNLIDLLLRDSLMIYPHLFQYRFICLGVSYILLGRYLELGKHSVLTAPLYFIGAACILSQTYALGKFSISTKGFWKIITALVIMLFFYLSVPFKSKIFFYLAAIFSFLFVMEMSYQISGWLLFRYSVAFLFMLIGYLAFTSRNK